MKRVLTVLLILLLLVGLFACKDKDGSADAVEYEVSYSTSLLPYAVTTPASEKVKKGETATAPTLDATPSAGKTVIWTTDTTTSIAYDFSAPVESDLILFAVEVPRPYKIIYLIEHGKNSKKNPTTYTKASETISLYAPTPEFGYKFWKWSYFDDKESNVIAIETDSEGDIVLRADIRPANYTILYADAGENNPNPSVYTFGTTLLLETPEKEGYTFKGYTIYGDGKRTPVTALTAEFVTEYRAKLFHETGSEIYLQANWEKNG